MTAEIPATEPPKVSEVRSALAEILAALEVGRIIVIDDEYAAPDLAPPDIIGFVQSMPDRFVDLVPGLGELEEEETDLIARAVRYALEADGAGALEARVRALGSQAEVDAPPGDKDAALDTVEATENKTREVLAVLCEELEQRFEAISATEWEERRDELLADGEGRALILVDRDFSEEGKHDNYGLELIRDLVTMSDEARPYCALFSHTVLPASELQQWRELAAEQGLARDRFVVISKARLGEDEPDFVGFIHLLRMAALSGPLEQLRTGAATLLAQAIDETKAEMAEWNVFDLDQVVLRSSHHEGVWEGDTLLRVMARFTLSKARREFLADGVARSHLAIARKASSVTVPGREQVPWLGIGAGALAYQRTELYEPGDFVNPHCLPIEAGDVFTDSNGKDFVLLAQPCDLMVRHDSGRAYDNKQALMVPLCEVRSGPVSSSTTGYTLEHWAEDGTPAHVRFVGVHLVRLAMLDLCAFQEDGQSRFVPGEAPNIRLAPAWKAHHSRVHKALGAEWETACENIKVLGNAKIDKNVRRRLVKSAMPLCSNTGRFRASQQEKGFLVNLQRTCRIRPALAADVLRAYTRYQSRTAFDHPVVTKELAARIAAGESDE